MLVGRAVVKQADGSIYDCGVFLGRYQMQSTPFMILASPGPLPAADVALFRTFGTDEWAVAENFLNLIPAARTIHYADLAILGFEQFNVGR